MKGFRSYIMLAGAIAIYSGLRAQDKAAAGLLQQFNSYRSHTLQEKLFMHSDKDFYVAGEIVWFKLYDVDASFHRPLDLSKIAYVELLDKNNKAVMQAKIALTGGSGYGSFYLPVSISSGHYLLRAYTSWMKNFNPAFYFQKQLTIVNSLKALTVPASDILPAYDIQFFPEGGNLVQNVESNIGFRVTDQYGKGMNFTGILVDENNDSLRRFQPLVFGLGHFSFTPLAGHTYRAIIKMAGGETIIRPFPMAQARGYILQLTEANDTAIRLSVTTTMPDTGIYIFAQAREVSSMSAYVPFVNNKAVITVSKSSLGDGITQFTVFDRQMQPVCERLYFKSPSSVLPLAAEGHLPHYHQREKVSFTVHSKTPSDLSMAVYRLDSLQKPEEMNINNYLWLSSELGPIESPAYYFSHSGAAAREAVDNLMLTHGWRRFSWKKILRRDSSALQHPPEYDGHIVRGRIVNAATGMPATGIKTMLAIPGVQSHCYNMYSDTSGNIHFDVRDFFGPHEIVVQTAESDTSHYRIEIANPFSEQYAPFSLLPLNIPFSASASLTESHLSMQVQNAYAAEHLQKFTPPVLDTVPFYGNRCVRYMLDDYTRFVTTEEVLREYVVEIGVRRHKGQYVLRVSNGAARGLFTDEPLVLLDGVPVSHEKILSYDPLKIRKIEAVPYKYWLGDFSYDGVASFTTYAGVPEDLHYDAKTLVIDYEGLQLEREFYSPEYATEAQVANRMPDFRNLLYWSPTVKTDDKGQAHVNFYTSDMPGRYIAVTQGLDAQGHAGSYSFVFEVSGR